MKWLKNNWYWLVLGLSVIIFCFGLGRSFSANKAKFQDTYSCMTKLPSEIDMSTPKGNFQANFRYGVVIRQIDDKKDLMRTSYVFQQGIIPTGRLIINTVEKVNITKKGKANYVIKPTGDLVAFSASSNNVDKSTNGFKNKQAQVKGAKKWLSEYASAIVNHKDEKQLQEKINDNLKVVKSKNGSHIVELQSGNMKSDLIKEYKAGTPSNSEFKYQQNMLVTPNTKVRNNNLIETSTGAYGRFN